MSIDALVRTLGRPPVEFARAWALECPATQSLTVRVLPALAPESITLPRADELVLWFAVPGAESWSSLKDHPSDEEWIRACGFRFEADR